jgi:hypothetical protein
MFSACFGAVAFPCLDMYDCGAALFCMHQRMHTVTDLSRCSSCCCDVINISSRSHMSACCLRRVAVEQQPHRHTGSTSSCSFDSEHVRGDWTQPTPCTTLQASRTARQRSHHDHVTKINSHTSILVRVSFSTAAASSAAAVGVWWLKTAASAC